MEMASGERSLIVGRSAPSRTVSRPLAALSESGPGDEGGVTLFR